MIYGTRTECEKCGDFVRLYSSEELLYISDYFSKASASLRLELCKYYSTKLYGAHWLRSEMLQGVFLTCENHAELIPLIGDPKTGELYYTQIHDPYGEVSCIFNFMFTLAMNRPELITKGALKTWFAKINRVLDHDSPFYHFIYATFGMPIKSYVPK